MSFGASAITRPTEWAGYLWSVIRIPQRDVAQLAALGLRGVAIPFVNYLDELPHFCAEVLPRLARSALRE